MPGSSVTGRYVTGMWLGNNHCAPDVGDRRQLSAQTWHAYMMAAHDTGGNPFRFTGKHTYCSVFSRPHFLCNRWRWLSSTRVSIYADLAVAVQVVKQNELVSDGVVVRRDTLAKDREPFVAVSLLISPNS